MSTSGPGMRSDASNSTSVRCLAYFASTLKSFQDKSLRALDAVTRNGLLSLVDARIKEEWFGNAFPFACQDGQGNAGCDTERLKTEMATFGVIWPGERRGQFDDDLSDGQVFDVLEFSYEYIAKPEEGSGHARFADSVSELRGAGGVARCHDTQACSTVVHGHNSRKS